MVAEKLDIQKKQHRERSQPLKRQRLGLLEKHADYVKRARDFHSKEDRIKKLREKAAGKNKDEFYFGMINSRTSKGVHIQSRGNESLPTDLIKVLKTQDAGYIRTQRAIEEGRVERLQQKLHTLIETPNSEQAYDSDDMNYDQPSSSSAIKGKHISFSSDLDAVRSGDLASIIPKRPVASTSTLPSKKRARRNVVAITIDPAVAVAEEAARVESAIAYRKTVSTELSARQERLHHLTRALRELETQRLIMGNGAKKSIVAKRGPVEREDDDGKNGFNDRSVFDGAAEGIATGARVFVSFPTGAQDSRNGRQRGSDEICFDDVGSVDCNLYCITSFLICGADEKKGDMRNSFSYPKPMFDALFSAPKQLLFIAEELLESILEVNTDSLMTKVQQGETLTSLRALAFSPAFPSTNQLSRSNSSRDTMASSAPISSSGLNDYKENAMRQFHLSNAELQKKAANVHATYIQPAMKSAVQVGSDRPLLASLATIFLALSIVPLVSFTIFAVTTLLVVVGGTAAFALFWCGILIGGAAFALVATLTVTGFLALGGFFWGLVMYETYRLLVNVTSSGSMVEGLKAFETEGRALFLGQQPIIQAQSNGTSTGLPKMEKIGVSTSYNGEAL